MKSAFWVLEADNLPLYFGEQCGRAHKKVGIKEALKFPSKEDAEKALRILNELGANLSHKPTEHIFI